MNSASFPSFPLPRGLDAGHAAFLLDFDGTLVDIAPSPGEVRVAPGLRAALTMLRDRCGGAVAIVTGRPIEQIDHFLPGVAEAVCGEHGVAIRRHPSAAIERADVPAFPRNWLEAAEHALKTWPGATLERKNAGVVLHYRAAPDAGAALRDMAEDWLAGQSIFELHPAKMAWEIRPAGIDKGHAVQAVMQQPPFAGRRPVFVGDDVTDEDGIRAARALGGAGFRIPEDFPDAAAFRSWLTDLAARSRWDG
ncbi:trehalose-phosphatase [Acidomonas methanolica]|uniref:Trehalose 6-phosphate phosphatase n=3 Tax=Acidomonas methanolica TaxID=437 RepID=A0A023D9C5_ACIMT|nr:trehalose-phosphatase [Acidomonas methanolica]MBU2653844.1 trehalose-phosphatase [Acidomonas methanolica]TCS20568.1 trehalose 6-phosphatase [Acidomonas methanolica]GAJ30723.1 trehalose phosphatase [Acidomonas methanolica NBRC 104435]GEL00526.1 trehalose 6-phosphate phosphatase [Acidomonas methanolica NBRC 104435]